MRTVIAHFGRFIASVVMLAMLTSSIAMAAYVCPDVSSDSATMNDMANCSDMRKDDQQPVHCAEHRSGDKQALEHSGSTAALALPAVISVQLISRSVLPPWQVLTKLASPIGFSSHAPPFLRTQRLRI
jgi:hypothetical protein